MKKATIYGMNVLQGHTHLWGQEPTPCGRYIGATHGCAAHPDRAEYKLVRTTTFSQWQRGFATIVDGRLSLYHSERTDWRRELAELSEF